MKKLYIIAISSVILASCGGDKSVDDLIASKDLKEIRAKKTELTTERQELNAELKKLDDAIAELDSIKNYPLVTTINVKDTLFKHYIELQGSVETKQNVLVYPEMAGTLLRVYVKEGQKVRKGQLLATIDDGGMSSQVAQVEAQTQLAKTTYERQKRLWEQKIGSEIAYLQAKTTYEAQENALKQMKSQLAKTSIRAPFSGVIDDVIKEQGTVVAPGVQSEVFRIVNLDNMYIQTEVPEKHLPNITAGKDVEVYFPVLGKTLSTKVRQVGNYINPNNRSFKIEIPVPSNGGNIKPNLTAKVRINDYTNEKAILIPQSIISENADGDQYVYVTTEKDSKNLADVARTTIKTGLTQGDYVEVLDGIKSNTSVIEEGARSVKDGQKVEITNKK